MCDCTKPQRTQRITELRCECCLTLSVGSAFSARSLGDCNLKWPARYFAWGRATFLIEHVNVARDRSLCTIKGHCAIPAHAVGSSCHCKLVTKTIVMIAAAVDTVNLAPLSRNTRPPTAILFGRKGRQRICPGTIAPVLNPVLMQSSEVNVSVHHDGMSRSHQAECSPAC